MGFCPVWLWIPTAIALCLSGCRHSVGGDGGAACGRRVLSAERVRELAGRNLLDVRVDELMQRLRREYADQSLLLSVPGRIREHGPGGGDAERASSSVRLALEQALAYQRQLLTPGTETGASLARARCMRQLELECDEAAAELSSLKDQLAMLQSGRSDVAAAKTCERELPQVRRALSEKYVEIRTLIGAEAEADLDLSRAEIPMVETPAAVQLELALSLRPEFADTPVPPGELAAAARKLKKSMLPGEEDPVLHGWRCVGMMLRLPRRLEEREAAERRTAPATRYVLAAMAVDLQLTLDRAEVSRCRKESESASAASGSGTDSRLRHERSELALRLANLRLAADLGLPAGTGSAAAPSEGSVSVDTESAVNLLVKMFSGGTD